MKYKKFLILPLLYILYVYFVVDMLTGFVPIDVMNADTGGGGGAQAIGVGDAATISVVRPYFFGLVDLPVYANYLGDIGGFHSAFFSFLGALAAVFVGLEVRNAFWGTKKVDAAGELGYIKEVRDYYNGKVKGSGRQRGIKEESYLEEKTMPEKKGLLNGGLDVKKLLKVLAVAFGIGLIHFFITAMGEAPDGNITWALILLLIYLGYKL